MSAWWCISVLLMTRSMMRYSFAVVLVGEVKLGEGQVNPANPARPVAALLLVFSKAVD